MLNAPRARRGTVTAADHLASEPGLRVLCEGGNAIEATIAMAATLAVVYPHRTAMGGHGFWLVARPGGSPLAIDACGGAAAAATSDLYAAQGLDAVPWRSPPAGIPANHLDAATGSARHGPAEEFSRFAGWRRRSNRPGNSQAPRPHPFLTLKSGAAAPADGVSRCPDQRGR